MKNNRTFLEKLLDGAEVEWKPLKEIAEYIRGITYNKTNESPNNIGYKILRANNITLSSNTLNFDDIKVIKFDTKVKSSQMLYKNDILISAASGSREHVGKVAFIYQDIDYYFGGFMGVIRCNNNVNSRYLFHIFTSSIFQYYLNEVLNSSTINNLNSKVMDSFRLPIPPLPVQTKIVKILDALTALTSELTSELILRRKQYEYYREKLLNIDEMNKVIELGDVGPVRMCKRILKNQTASSGDIPFYKIGTFGKKPDAYISNKLFQEYKQKYSYPKKGDILISASGTIGRTVIFDGQNSYFQDSNIVWIDNDETLVLNKYLYHFYKIAKWGIAEGGTIQRLYNDNLKKVKISIPPLKEQHRIVSILDKFETLTNSITEGLPLAIEQSKKRYEYYRELLLNFS